MWGCSSAGRAPALQAGGHRFDPGQLHQIRNSAASRSKPPSSVDGDFNLEAGCDLRIGSRFHQPQGWPFSAKERVWMFDNEIDWVTRLECCEPAVRRAERRKIRERIHTRPSTSNESAMIQASVQSKKSVFRSCNRTHVNAIELLSRRITGTNLRQD